jgi:predicted RNA-binding protein with PUA-like domain
MPAVRHYWLVKTEPDCFSIDDLARSLKQTTCWDGVRNYQARNFMKTMKRGERVLFYHSSTEPMAIVGVADVAREAYPDSTAWDPENDHFDPKSSPENPIWEMVDLKLKEIFPEPITLAALRSLPALAKMELLRKGSRLSVQPVTEKEFETIVKLAHASSKWSKRPSAKPAKRSRIASRRS